MSTTPPSTVRVTIGQNRPTVTNISYGVRTIKSSTDLDMSSAIDGDAIIYQANTNSFVLAPVELVPVIDGGIY